MELHRRSPFPPPELEESAWRVLKATSVVWNRLSRGIGTSENGMPLSKGFRELLMTQLLEARIHWLR